MLNNRSAVAVPNRHFTQRSLLAALVLSFTLSITLGACGGNKKAVAENATEGATSDITRPPQTIVGRQEVQERNPEETISFDEWRKRRLEEQRKQQTP